MAPPRPPDLPPKVLLLEAGGSSEWNPFVSIPGGVIKLFASALVRLETVLQAGHSDMVIIVISM
jgi:hypothetical protein